MGIATVGRSGIRLWLFSPLFFHYFSTEVGALVSFIHQKTYLDEVANVAMPIFLSNPYDCCNVAVSFYLLALPRHIPTSRTFRGLGIPDLLPQISIAPGPSAIDVCDLSSHPDRTDID